MTPEQIEELARKANLTVRWHRRCDDPTDINGNQLESIVRLVADRCAEICEERTMYLSCSKNGHGIADAIRKEFDL